MAKPDTSGPESREMLTAHRAAIHRYILSMMRDPAEAEDLTQDTFLRAHNKLPTLKDHSKLVAWLYRIATNVCRDRFRQASWRNRPQSLDAPPDGATAVSEAEALADDAPRLDLALQQAEMSSCVQDYVATLPDSYRSVILLHDCEAMTNPEIADMLELTLSTVKIRLHRARTKLRAVLDKACSFSDDERGVRVCEPKPPDEKQ